MEYILVLLIVALLNGAIAYIDGLMEGSSSYPVRRAVYVHFGRG